METEFVTAELMQRSDAMISYGYSLMRRVKTTFVAVHMARNPYGEVDPIFVSGYIRGSVRCGIFIDRRGTHHQVIFNDCAENPLLTDGWSNLRQAFHMTQDNKVCFFYLGNSEFHVSHLPDHVPPHKYPTFHSRFATQQQQPDCTIDSFEVKICPYIELERSLVLPSDISDHIKKHNFHPLLL